jgi:putative ABC transport system permease protein
VIRGDVRRFLHLALRRRDRWEQEVEDEIKLHLAMRAEQLMQDGRSADEAYEEAVRRFGGGSLNESRAQLFQAARHREQRMQRTEYLDDLRQDFRFALRTLGRQKAWTAVALITLALGIGATTAVFSAVSSLLLHPLPYPHSDRVVYIDMQPTEGNRTGMSVSIVPPARVVSAWMERAHSFEALEPYGFNGDMALGTTSGEPSSVRTARVGPGFMKFAGERTIIGRMFDSTDIRASGRVAVLAESFWRERLASNPAVLGQTLKLDDSLYTVVGVAPASLRSPWMTGSPPEVWLPIDIHSEKTAAKVIGRLRPGVGAAVAARELDSAWSAVRSAKAGKLPFVSRVQTPAQTVAFRDSLLLLAGAVALVLLVACANVAHLLLARGATRSRELALRAALGAGRGRLLRQLIVESLTLSVSGSALGFVLGWLGLRGLLGLRPARLTELATAHLDGTTLVVAIALAIASGLVFGVVGSLQFAHSATHESLKAGSLSTSPSRTRVQGRALLVVSEMALSATLVVGATMLIRSVSNLQHADLGFDPRGLYHVEATLPKQRYPKAEDRAQFFHTLAERLRGMPGVTAMTLPTTPPGWRSFSVGRFEVQGEPPKPVGTTEMIDVNTIDGNYFRAMGMRLVDGSMFRDSSSTSNEVIVNAGFARRHWPGQSAVGHRVRVANGESDPWKTIVGVASDALTTGPSSESSAPLIYSPADPSNERSIVLRTSGDASTLGQIKGIVRSIDPRVVANVTGIEKNMADAISTPRFVTTLLTSFTLLAVVLAAIGMYGVMAYSVSQKTREIGIRVALGAPRQRIARTILGRGATLAVAGAVLGMIAARWGTKLIEKQLYGVTRTDVASFVVAAVVLVGTAILACVVPTRRALAVDPMTAIRAD